jgi:hypothetical protein
MGYFATNAMIQDKITSTAMIVKMICCVRMVRCALRERFFLPCGIDYLLLVCGTNR